MGGAGWSSSLAPCNVCYYELIMAEENFQCTHNTNVLRTNESWKIDPRVHVGEMSNELGELALPISVY